MKCEAIDEVNLCKDEFTGTLLNVNDDDDDRRVCVNTSRS